MNLAILKSSLIYGVILSVLTFFLIFGSLYYNPEIWLNDYLPDIRQKYGPASEKTQRQNWLIALTLRPKFMILPGTEGSAGYHDYGFHFMVFSRGR